MKGRRQAGDHEGRLRGLMWAGLIVLTGGGTLAVHLFADAPAMRRLAEHPSTWHATPWVNALRQLGRAYIPIWLVLLWSGITNRWRPTAVTLVALLLVVPSVSVLKVLSQRDRPREARTVPASSAPDVPTNPWWGRVSFPSGDTAAVFAAATALTLATRWRWAPLLFAAAGIVGVSRVTAQAHYPSDIFAGAMIGVLCGLYALHVVARRWPEHGFTLRRRPRLVLVLVVVLVVPALSPRLGMTPLLIFLRFYALPVAALMAMSAWVERARPG